MSDEFNKLAVTAVKSQEQAAEVVEKLFDVAQPSLEPRQRPEVGSCFGGRPLSIGQREGDGCR